MITNKEDFKKKPEVYRVLVQLETAIVSNDELSIGFALTKLDQLGFKVAIEDNEQTEMFN